MHQLVPQPAERVGQQHGAGVHPLGDAAEAPGPWYTAYMLAITASSTCAVQTLLVALSRRMCCSRVCSAMRSAGRPSRSRETPMIRPGRSRLYASLVAKKAAWGPP